MNKRLTHVQKMFAVYCALINAEHPMSRTSIAKAIGFKSGKPLIDVIDELKSRQLLKIYEGVVCGITQEYYWADEVDLIEIKEYISIISEVD